MRATSASSRSRSASPTTTRRRTTRASWNVAPTDKLPIVRHNAKEGHRALDLKSPAGEWVRSFTIVTCAPNELCAQIHDRMPVILPAAAWPLWLGEEPAEPAQLKALLAPYPADDMAMWPVDRRVGNVRNNDPSLIEQIALN